MLLIALLCRAFQVSGLSEPAAISLAFRSGSIISCHHHRCSLRYCLGTFYPCSLQLRVFCRVLFLYDDSRLSLAQLLFGLYLRSPTSRPFSRGVGRCVSCSRSVDLVTDPASVHSVGNGA